MCSRVNVVLFVFARVFVVLRVFAWFSPTVFQYGHVVVNGGVRVQVFFCYSFRVVHFSFFLHTCRTVWKHSPPMRAGFGV